MILLNVLPCVGDDGYRISSRDSSPCISKMTCCCGDGISSGRPHVEGSSVSISWVFSTTVDTVARGSVEFLQCTTTSTTTDGTLIGGSGTTGEGSFAAKFHFSHDPRSHVVQTGSELGSCWHIGIILIDRAISYRYHSGIVLAPWRSLGLPLVRCPMRSFTNYQDAITVDDSNATVLVRCYCNGVPVVYEFFLCCNASWLFLTCQKK